MFHYHPAARGHAPARAARVPSTGGACSACRACSCGVSLCWSGLRLCYRPLAAARASGSRPATGSASDRSSVVRCWPAPLAGPRQPPIARVLLVLASGRPPPRRPLLPRTGPPPLREDARQEDPRAIHLSWRFPLPPPRQLRAGAGSTGSRFRTSRTQAKYCPARASFLRLWPLVGKLSAAPAPHGPASDPSLALRTPSQPCAARPAPRGDGLRPPRAPSPNFVVLHRAPNFVVPHRAPPPLLYSAPRSTAPRRHGGALRTHHSLLYTAAICVGRSLLSLVAAPSRVPSCLAHASSCLQSRPRGAGAAPWRGGGSPWPKSAVPAAARSPLPPRRSPDRSRGLPRGNGPGACLRPPPRLLPPTSSLLLLLVVLFLCLLHENVM